MNRLFYVQELVQQIAFSADKGSAGSSSLLALACCCKTLEGPVMDVLWQRQRFLHIILTTLPADCWTVTDLVYRLIRTPTSEEWERFRIYTGRVIQLDVEGLFLQGVTSETMSFLRIQSTIDPLWPRLTSLRLTNRLSWDSVASTLAFLSPKIKTLELILPRDTSILLQPILSTVSERCRRVQELVLDVMVDGPNSDPNSSHWAGGLISACGDTLRTLEIRSPFKAVYLPILVNLPQLRKLCLDSAYFPPGLPFDAFPALEEFTFLRFQGHSLQNFLRPLRTTGLSVAQIYSANDIDIKNSVAELRRFSNSIRYLGISAVTGLDLLRFPAPRPLFINLKTLHLRCFPLGDTFHSVCAFQPSDRAIAELGTLMPNLTDLILGSPTCTILQCVTFLSLISLSNTCHDLETLAIKVDFTTMISLSLSAGEGTGTNAVSDQTQGNGCRLRRLVVGSSIVPDHPNSEWHVAIGLGKVFPSLSVVDGFEGYDWERVEENIRMSREGLRPVW